MHSDAPEQAAEDIRPGGISREEHSELSRRNNTVAALHLGARACFHIGLCAGVLHAWATGQWLLSALFALPQLATMSFLGWAGIGHELYHNSVFSGRRSNQGFYWLCSILSWSNPGYFQVSHPYHHRHTLARDDAEGIPSPAFDRRAYLLMWTFDYISFYRRLRILGMNAFGIVPGGASGATLFPENSSARARLCNGARAVLAVHAGLAFTFVWLDAAALLLLVTLAPFCLTWFNRTLAIMQHYGLPGAERNYYRSCRTVLLNPVVAFFYANMNYHLEHHFYPGVPFYNLPRLHRLFRERTPYENMASGYFEGLRTLRVAGLFGKVPN